MYTICFILIPDMTENLKGEFLRCLVSALVVAEMLNAGFIFPDFIADIYAASDVPQ